MNISDDGGNVTLGVRAEKKEKETGIIRWADTATSGGFGLVLQQARSLIIFEAESYAKVKALIENDVYWTGDVVRTI